MMERASVLIPRARKKLAQRRFSITSPCTLGALNDKHIKI
jgi:hypothetical protein